jgi:hypothetical protein
MNSIIISNHYNKSSKLQERDQPQPKYQIINQKRIRIQNMKIKEEEYRTRRVFENEKKLIEITKSN